jgi:hypothetical protein
MSVRVQDMSPLPVAANLDDEGLAQYEATYTSRFKVWAEVLERNVENIHRGSYSLHWMNTDKANWGKRAKPSSRGMTYTDINRIRGYGDAPDKAEWFNFAPRGCVREPYRHEMPVIEEYTVVDKGELWADNIITLYEEAKARQWNATRDIAWDELEALPDDLEKATCQLCTFLTEIEFAAGDFPAKWMYRIPQDFLEVKSFLATQIMDEARHQEVFRKRAIAGGGLLHAAPGFEWALTSILNAPTHTMGTFLLNLLGEGLVLSIFRSGEMIAKTHVDKEIFRRCLQDEARHVSYGVLEFKNYLDTHPNRAAAEEQMHRFCDIGEQVVLSAFVEPALIEPIAVLLGGGLKKIDEGMGGVAHMWRMFIQEYLQRCKAAGFDRSARCTIPTEFPWGAAA